MTKTFDYYFHHNHLASLPAGSPAQIAWLLAQRLNRGLDPHKRLIITPDIGSAKQVEKILTTHTQNADGIYLFPDWETLGYDTVSPSGAITRARYKCINALSQNQARIVVVAAQTLMYLLPEKSFFQSHVWQLSINDQANLNDLTTRLAHIGYHHVDRVTEPGSYSVKGSIIDVFPSGFDQPFRLDYFDNTIENIYLLNLDDLSRSKKVKSITCFPKHECIIDSTTLSRFTDKWHQYKNSAPPSEWISNLKSRRNVSGYQYFLPTLHDSCVPLTSYLDTSFEILCLDHVEQQYESAYQGLVERYQRRDHAHYLEPEYIAVPWNKIAPPMESSRQVRQDNTSLFAPIEETSFHRLQERWPHERFVIVAETAARLSLLTEQLAGSKPHTIDANTPLQCHHLTSRITLLKGSLLPPFRIPSWQISILSQSYLYSKHHAQRAQNNDNISTIDIQHLKSGDLVIHRDHGLGRYVGMSRENEDHGITEFLHISYANDALILLNIERIDLLTLYYGPLKELDHLGKKKWSNRIKKVQQDIDTFANQLLAQQKKRQVTRAHACIPTEDYQRFCDRFLFEPTDCQWQCFDAVTQDMSRDVTMDRLICGDVGFGKTEIAMRAACLAVENGLQVILLAPTTILAEQHYQSFVDRFTGTAVRIELLSRHLTSKKLNTVINDVNNGCVDIVVSTHLGTKKSIEFKHLGLIIIDEEHRFGVSIKQHWIKHAPHAHRLLLSATPIPRTLNQAFSKLTCLNIMTSPPEGRTNIITTCSSYDQEICVEAIARELNRGGQIYLVCNDIAQCSQWKDNIQRLFPEISIAIGHGQMRISQLESIMHEFKINIHQVLIATTIIESGIDIPNANTIIIMDAQNLGLAQLHQLRGRVGRSSQQAYAYLFIHDRKACTPQALARLDAITSGQSLGGGAQLAIQDLEIRGAGHILGKEQSGHVDSIGIGLYTQLLKEATSDSASDKVQCEFNVQAYICSTLLPDAQERLSFYQKIFHAGSIHALEVLKEQFLQRFGVIPDPTKNLFQLESLKRLMHEKRIPAMIESSENILITLSEDSYIDHAQLITAIQKKDSPLAFVNQSCVKIASGPDPVQSAFDALSLICA